MSEIQLNKSTPNLTLDIRGRIFHEIWTTTVILPFQQKNQRNRFTEKIQRIENHPLVEVGYKWMISVIYFYDLLIINLKNTFLKLKYR